MAYDGNGTFSKVESWRPSEEASLTPPDNYVQSDSAQAGLDEISAGLSLCFLRDGRATATGTFKMGGYKVTGLQGGSESSDAVNYSQLVSVEDSLSTGKANINLQNVSSSGYASETTRGIAEIATKADVLAGLNDTKMVTPLKIADLVASKNIYPPKFIQGFVPEYIDTDNIKATGGSCRDENNAVNILTETEYTKSISQSWVAGDGGGVAQGITIGNEETFHLFVISGGSVAATQGTFTTDNILSNLASFQAISDGYLAYTIDGGGIQSITNLDFTSVTSLGDIAIILDGLITDANVFELNDTIVFQSLSTGVNSSVEIFASTATGTDMFGASYLDGANGLAVQGQGETPASVDYGYDTAINAINLFLDPNVISGGFTNYRRIASFITSDVGEVRDYDWTGTGKDWEVLYKGQYIDSGDTGSIPNPLNLEIPNGIKLKPILYAGFDNISYAKLMVDGRVVLDSPSRSATAYTTQGSAYIGIISTITASYDTTGSIGGATTGDATDIKLFGYKGER